MRTRDRLLLVVVGLATLASGSSLTLAWVWHPRLGWWAVAFVVGWLVISAAVAHAVLQPVVRRLYGLEEAAALIAAGRLHHRMDDASTGDEIGRIAHQFNRMAEKIEEQVKTLRKLVEENSALAGQAERLAVNQERQRLARELHDSVSQELFALSMLAASGVHVQQQGGDVGTLLQQIAEIATTAQREMRALLLHLRPAELEGRSFVEAARAFLDAIADRHQLRCALDVRTETHLEPAVEEQLFRILQEAVANVLKHAGASEIRVIWEDDGSVGRLTVLDDGSGIELHGDAAAVRDETYGMRAMRERAATLGGRFAVWRRARGTAVEVQIPILADPHLN